MQIDTLVFQTGMVEGTCISLSIDSQFLANFELRKLVAHAIQREFPRKCTWRDS